MGKLLYLFTRPWFLFGGGLLAILWIAYLALFEWNGNAMVTSRQARLFEFVSNKKWGKCDAFVSESYHDQWDFDKAGALLSLKDIGSQFLVLHIEVKELFVIVDGKTGRAETRVRLSGSGSPLSQLIVTEANRIEPPFIVHWRKESWTPWSWRIVRIENTGMPDLHGYRPGDLSRALRDPDALTP
jgi:hypothetical protein